jgi:hypothetical protein
MSHQLTFNAVSEPAPGPKWRACWDLSSPAYCAWFTARNGDDGPDRAACEAALAADMPELVPEPRSGLTLHGAGLANARGLTVGNRGRS